MEKPKDNSGPTSIGYKVKELLLGAASEMKYYFENLSVNIYKKVLITNKLFDY